MLCFHGDCLWLDSQIFVDVNLIDSITRLSKVGVDMEPFFSREEQDKIIVAWIKKKYNFTLDKRGINIASINDQGIGFAAKVLLSKLLQNIQLN